MALQKIDAEQTNMPESIPTLEGVRYYLAVPHVGQPWQMAIYDENSGKWRAIGLNELQSLAQAS